MNHSDTNLSNKEWFNLNRNFLSPEVVERFESVLDSDCIIKKLENEVDFQEETICELMVDIGRLEQEIIKANDTIDELNETIEKLEQYIRDRS